MSVSDWHTGYEHWGLENAAMMTDEQRTAIHQYTDCCRKVAEFVHKAHVCRESKIRYYRSWVTRYAKKWNALFDICLKLGFNDDFLFNINRGFSNND